MQPIFDEEIDITFNFEYQIYTIKVLKGTCFRDISKIISQKLNTNPKEISLYDSQGNKFKNAFKTMKCEFPQTFMIKRREKKRF